MKKLSIILLIFMFSSCVSMKNINQLKHIKSVPYIDNCNDVIFWNLVEQKDNIPALIEKLTDETILKDVYVPNFGGEYTVADVSLIILQEKIKDIPILEIIGKESDKTCGYCVYWNFVRENKNNRIELKNNFRKWFELNKSKLIWVNSDSSLTGDCQSQVKGHYEIKK